MNDTIQKIIIFLACVLCLIPVQYYINLIINNAVNTPFFDDFDSIARFINLFTDTDSLGEKLNLVLSQHNEHRMAFLRLVAVSVFYLWGHLDFILLCYIGNAALALIAYFLFRSFKTNGKYKVLFFSPVVFLLFQPQYYDTLLLPTTLLSSFYVSLFALVTLFFIEKKSRISFIAACIFSVCTAFTLGNGLLIFPLGLASFCLQRSFRRAGLWLLISLLVGIIYFTGYGLPSGHPGVTEALFNIKRTILYALSLTGSAAGFSSFYPSFFCGIGIVLYFIFLTASKYHKNNPTLYLFFLFILLTIGINALLRSGQGVEYAFTQPRYKFIAIFPVILTYLSLREIVRGKQGPVWVTLTGLILALVFFTVSFTLYSPKVEEYSETLKRGLIRWHVDGSGLFYPYPEKASDLLNKLIEKSIYRFPENIPKEFSKSPSAFHENNITRRLESYIDSIAENDEYVYVDGWALFLGEKTNRQTTSIVLRSSEHTLAVPTVTIRRPDLATHFRSRRLKKSGFGVLISKKMLQPGRYELGVYTKSSMGSGLNFSGKHILIKK